MFFIPTHNRVEKLKRFFASLGVADLWLPFRILLWHDDPAFSDYMEQEWPCPIITLTGKASYCNEKLNEAFRVYPNEPWYGFFGDDVVVKAKNSLHLLIERAERWNIAFPDEGNGWPGHVVIGGNLLRAMGFFAHPDLKHNCIDSVWNDIGLHFNLLRPCPEIECFLENAVHRDERQCPMDEAYARVQTINQTASFDYHRFWLRRDQPIVFERIERALHGQRTTV